jgi:hypothetical protein
MLVARSVLVVFSGSLLVARPAPAQGITRLESVDSSGNVGNNSSGTDINDGDRGLAISADGQIVVFASKATNLVAGDTNGQWDIFVHDNTTGVTERVSVDSSGAEANDDCRNPSISADGMVVAFESAATNLVAGDTNARYDVFVHDRATGITERASVDSSGAQANDGTQGSNVSADGNTVVFGSFASNLVAGDTNGMSDFFVHDRASGITERVSVDSSGAESNDYSIYRPSISADGRVVAFDSLASNLVAGDTNGVLDVFVHDRTTGITERVDVDSAGNETTGRIFQGPTLSGDGQVVAFPDDATNLVPGGTNGWLQVFAHDRNTGVTELMSVDSNGVEANYGAQDPRISTDGRCVAFVSDSTNLVAGDRNNYDDVFVHDRIGGFTDCASLGLAGVPAYGESRVPALGADGEIVAFSSDAGDLVGVYGWNVYERERCNAAANWSNYGAGFPGTFGVPTFTARSFPTIGSTVALDLANSYGGFSAGVLYVATARAQLHTSLGGDLLLVPEFGVVIGLPPAGYSLQGNLARDDALCGILLDLQALELDPGAVKGVSFTAGLEVTIGH